METIYKTFRPEVKSVDEKEGLIDMLIPMSTASIDRDGESIDPLGWKKSLPNFRKRPVLLSSHNYGDLRKQIGEFKTIKITEDGLMAKPKYYINEGNEEADWAFKLASKGMAAFSVGFIPRAWTDGDGEKEPRRTYTEQELLEISHVVVPSNRDAIQGVRSKSVDPVINEVIDDVLKDEELYADKYNKNFFHKVDVNKLTIPVEIKIGEAKDLPKSIPEHHKITQEQIIDEFDYIHTLIAKEGISDKSKDAVWKLVKEILRLTGDDIPDDIKTKFTVEVIRYIESEKSTEEKMLEAIKKIAERKLK